MQPIAVGYAVKARCSDCGGVISLFDFRDPGREFGYIVNDGHHTFEGRQFTRVHYRLLRCAGSCPTIASAASAASAGGSRGESCP